MILLDSSFLIALKIENDSHHLKAKNIMQQIIENRYGVPIITDYIFSEIVTVILIKSKSHKLSIEFGEELLNSLEMIKISNTIFEGSWKKFKESINNKFSFVDSSSISLMKIKGIKNIATFDEEFSKIKEINVVKD